MRLYSLLPIMGLIRISLLSYQAKWDIRPAQLKESIRIAAQAHSKYLEGSYFNTGEIDICFYRIISLEAFVFRQSTLKNDSCFGRNTLVESDFLICKPWLTTVLWMTLNVNPKYIVFSCTNEFHIQYLVAHANLCKSVFHSF